MTEDLPGDLEARARSGNLVAMRELLGAHLPELGVFVRLNASSDVLARESVSDVVQSVAGELLPELAGESFESVAGFRAWLRRAALNKLIDKQRHHRAAKRDVRREARVSASVADAFDLTRALAALPSPSQHAAGREDVERLERALARLHEDQRQAVTMARLLGMPHREIAEVLNKSEAACRMLLRRGMVNLARELDRV